MAKEKFWLFTLHLKEDEFRIKHTVLARNPHEAASLVGGEFIERDGGLCEASEKFYELGLCGTVRFPFELFHEMSAEEVYLAGVFLDNNTHCYNPVGLLTKNGEARQLFLRRQYIKIPDYVCASR